jgi:thiamine monophosphate kinase
MPRCIASARIRPIVATDGLLHADRRRPVRLRLDRGDQAISDVYAMGGRPLFALALVAMPIDKLPVETIRRILEGGESVCRRAGIPVAGGHSVDLGRGDVWPRRDRPDQPASLEAQCRRRAR